ncbi:sulfite exporter TauE/SafE family protein [Chelativorans sp. AA-79]|uniref:sulfite exporter TauE/SafE family protein n=1 Tax=Chelativorans sp. AA-79 TaxID=3028735 RepID=UPI0023F6E3D3|nr:sulfite exporter TauE/SafE family protein [Chelativorans sp. AA-79]WEX10704.1 sulfite exporter TauE/SafE family protein [Chelativorans sp. AA-79]
MHSLTSMQLTCLLLAGVLGGFVRGYSGFGFALAAVPLLNLAFAPALSIPSVLLVECAIGAATVAGQRTNVDWTALRPMMAGAVAGTPVGILCLRYAPPDLTRLAVAMTVLIAIAVLWRSPSLHWLGSPRALVTGGLISGVLNGGTAMSGPPAVLVLLGSPIAPRNARAVLMTFIFFSAALAVALTIAWGMQGQETILHALIMAPTVIVGAVSGVALFANLPHGYYRKGSFGVLLLVSVVTVVSVLWALGFSESA